MNKLIAAVIITLSFSAHAGLAFFKYERTTGLNKICVYDHMGSDISITIKSYKLCPITING